MSMLQNVITTYYITKCYNNLISLSPWPRSGSWPSIDAMITNYEWSLETHSLFYIFVYLSQNATPKTLVHDLENFILKHENRVGGTQELAPGRWYLFGGTWEEVPGRQYLDVGTREVVPRWWYPGVGTCMVVPGRWYPGGGTLVVASRRLCPEGGTQEVVPG